MKTNKKLADDLVEWYSRNRNNPSKWNDNPVGKTIKNILNDSKNWKNAPRGNPRKAYEVSLVNKGKKTNDW